MSETSAKDEGGGASFLNRANVDARTGVPYLPISCEQEDTSNRRETEFCPVLMSIFIHETIVYRIDLLFLPTFGARSHPPSTGTLLSQPRTCLFWPSLSCLSTAPTCLCVPSTPMLPIRCRNGCEPTTSTEIFKVYRHAAIYSLNVRCRTMTLKIS
ncbi:hypothetical protein KM043_006306 [Ampulex compressa]|nr:hypothetical protein KM043_006306 [Ampulex compressa]